MCLSHASLSKPTPKNGKEINKKILKINKGRQKKSDRTIKKIVMKF